jgi:hypothetical protein
LPDLANIGGKCLAPTTPKTELKDINTKSLSLCTIIQLRKISAHKVIDYQSIFHRNRPAMFSPDQDVYSRYVIDHSRLLSNQMLESMRSQSLSTYYNDVLVRKEMPFASSMAVQIAVAQLGVEHIRQLRALRLQSLQQIPVLRAVSKSECFSGLDTLATISSETLHCNNIDERTESTNSSQNRTYIDEIDSNDILCGRGGRSNHHRGNKRYRQVVGKMKYMYQQCPAKTLKTDLSRTIVEHCYSYGARFVKFDNACSKYYVLTKNEARKKTSQALRESKAIKWIV